MTKEDILKEYGKLSAELESYKTADEEVRTELSKLLGYGYTEKGMYGLDLKEKVEVLSWMQIASEIGKLTQIDKRFATKHNIEDINGELFHLREEILKTTKEENDNPTR
jgi:hypothetical protein